MSETVKSTKKTILKILRVAKNVLLVALVLCVLFVAGTVSYDKFVRKDPVPSFYGYSLLVIASPSMTGTIDPGSLVLIHSAPTYSVGDVVTYLPAGDDVSVTHRIVRTEGDKFITKGDANPSEDPDPVYVGRIRGKVVFCIPGLGVLVQWLKTPAGMIFFLAIITTCAAIAVVVQKQKKLAEENDEESSEENRK